VEPQRERIERVDAHGALEVRDVHARGDAADLDGLREGAVDEVDALEGELIDGDALDGGAREGLQLEEALEAGDGAARDDERARDEDRVEEVEGDLAVGSEALDGGDGVAVVGGEEGEEEVDGGEDVCFLFGASLFGGEGVAVFGEALEPGEEDLGLELGGRALGVSCIGW
jgi:hypothetical protein